MSTTLAAAVSIRVETLIARHHDGNKFAAAHSLGVHPEQLAGLLSGDWQRFSLDALAALVRGYGVNVDWLLAPPARDARVSAPRARRTRVDQPSDAGGRARDASPVLDVSLARGDDTRGDDALGA